MSSRSHQNLGKESVVPRGFYVTYDKTDPQHNNQIASERGEELFYSYPLEQNDICNECGSMEIDGVYKRNFDINVCTNCVQLKSEKYKLITKTTAKELYLLTDEELCDQGALPFILKPNPLNPSWSEMQLYLSMHVDDFAKKKWGSLDALEQEINCREARKGVQQEKRFNKRLLDLKRKTMTEQKRRKIELNVHEHSFTDQNGIKECRECGLTVEIEEF